jgi:hypothetical protein
MIKTVKHAPQMALASLSHTYNATWSHADISETPEMTAEEIATYMKYRTPSVTKAPEHAHEPAPAGDENAAFMAR